MRTTVTLNEQLLKDAMQAHGIKSKSDMINKLLAEEAHRRASDALAKMGGFDPDASFPDRRSHWDIWSNHDEKTSS